jgi:Fe2+ transport system protein FeoA
MTLDQLKKGQSAEIIAIETASNSVQRLMLMGLVEGAKLNFIGASIGGDPLEFQLYGSAVSLRRDDAEKFRVSLTDG